MEHNLNKMPGLTGLFPHEITQLTQLTPSFRGKQIFHHIHSGITSFDTMTDLPQNSRDLLKMRFQLYSSTINHQQKDEDGTLKITYLLEDGNIIEGVVLTDQNRRKTLCVSSQLGCAMACTFCKTGAMGLIRNLSAGEIVEQYLHTKKINGDINNVVFMGMGEPLANWKEVKKAIELLHLGSNIGFRRITLSTCGIPPGIITLSQELPTVRLAVSLVSGNQQKRAAVMPIARSYPLTELHRALTEYQQATGKRITLEYVLLGGYNHDTADIKALIQFSQGLNIVINIIPWNPSPGLDHKTPEQKIIQNVIAQLETANIPVTRRYGRGQNIQGACGQLASLQNRPNTPHSG